MKTRILPAVLIWAVTVAAITVPATGQSLLHAVECTGVIANLITAAVFNIDMRDTGKGIEEMNGFCGSCLTDDRGRGPLPDAHFGDISGDFLRAEQCGS